MASKKAKSKQANKDALDIIVGTWKKSKLKLDKAQKENIEKTLAKHLEQRQIHILTTTDLQREFSQRFGEPAKDFFFSILISSREAIAEVRKRGVREDKFLYSLHDRFSKSFTESKKFGDFPERWKGLNTDALTSS